DGCGGKVTANCAAGSECVANSTGSAGPAPASGVVGTCCTPSCTNASNTCSSGMVCNGSGNSCCTRPPACTGAGGEGGECNTQHDNSCGSPNVCACTGGRTCWCTDHACVPGVDTAGTCKSALTCSST